MSDEENQDIPMAECGACRTIIPLDSEECSGCGVRFGGVSDEALGECGSCGALQPIDSASCSECGVAFVADDVIEILQTWLTATGISVSNLFDRFDTDGDGEITAEEFKEGLLSLRLADLPPSQVDRLVAIIDEDDSGTIDIEELAHTFGQEAPAKEESSEDPTEEESEEEASEETEEEETEEAEEEDSEEDESEEAEEESEDEEEPSEDPEEETEEDSDSEEDSEQEDDSEEDDESDDEDEDDENQDEKEDEEEDKPARPEKEFPSDMQKFLMGKTANDVVYPIAYFLMVAFIGLWVVNGLGILVDGTGGTITYDGHTDEWDSEQISANWNVCEAEIKSGTPDPCYGTVEIGETYPCDPTIDPNGCQNSFTLFSGENGASSMPAGFYLDGIIMMVLGALGLGAVAFLHLSYAPALRSQAKTLKEGSDEEEDSDDDSDDDDSNDEPGDSEDSDEDDDDDEESDSEEDSDDESELEDDSEEDDESDDEDDDDDDDIDVGDWIGLEIDGEEHFGEIIEFDDDEGTVTIETDDGEEITGDQDDMFLEDDEDEDDE